MKSFTFTTRSLGTDERTIFINQVVAIDFSSYLKQLKIYLNNGYILSIRYFCTGSEPTNEVKQEAKQSIEDGYIKLMEFLQNDLIHDEFPLLPYIVATFYKDDITVRNYDNT